jgi:hypothetical protein
MFWFLGMLLQKKKKIIVPLDIFLAETSLDVAPASVIRVSYTVTISTFFCGNFISVISAVHNDTADLKNSNI